MRVTVRFSENIASIPAAKLQAPKASTCSPDLPTDVVDHIIRLGVGTRGLYAVSLLSKSWWTGSAQFMGKVRNLATNSVWSKPELKGEWDLPLLAKRYAVWRLGKEALPGALVSEEQVKLSNNLPRLWMVTGTTPSSPEFGNFFFRLRGLNKQSWSLLGKLGLPKAELNLLALNPNAQKVFSDDAQKKIYSTAQKWLENHLEEVGCGTLLGYSSAIGRIGANITPPYGSPFHKILLSSLYHRPLAYHGLISLATSCPVFDFFQFVQDVDKHFGQNVNISLTLIWTMARKLARTGKEELSAVSLEVLMDAMERIGHQYYDKQTLPGAAPQLLEQIKDERHEILLGIAKNMSAIIGAIPASDPASRKKVLKPLMAYLRSQAGKNKDARTKIVEIKAIAESDNWLPGNPRLKFK